MPIASWHQKCKCEPIDLQRILKQKTLHDPRRVYSWARLKRHVHVTLFLFLLLIDKIPVIVVMS